MYDRYKGKNKNKKLRKVIIALILIIATLYFGNRYKRYLMFWKYSMSKLEKRIEKAYNQKDLNRKRDQLEQLVSDVDSYKEESNVEPEAYFTSGKVHFLLGEAFLPGSFSELVVNDKSQIINARTHSQFIFAIKDIKKAIGLSGNSIDREYTLMLAKACYYTDYLTIKEISKIMEEVKNPEELPSVEDVRFYSIIGVLAHNDEQYIGDLYKYGNVNDSVLGKLFLATTERIAKQYTNSIIHYKEVLHKTKEKRILKLVHMNLGKIYYNQSLYKESLTHFNTANLIDNTSSILKIWIGKSYKALGEKDKAKAIWNDVLVKDKNNNEVKRLLGLL